MLSNTVAHNEIWREHVRKEDSLYRAPAPFRVDPKTIRPMPEKPNRTDPNTAHQVGREDVPLSLRETVPSRTTPHQPTARARWTSTTTAPSPRRRCANTTRCTPR